jgi:ubiquinone/menaquinone biosynthesis C-methylase UbiE
MSPLTASRPDHTTAYALSDELPPYSGELAAFHRAFHPELKTLIGMLPLSPDMQVFDVGCGDGFYLDLLAERLVAPGGVVGLDINPAYVNIARERLSGHRDRCPVRLILGTLDDLPVEHASCDLVWCAQSLYSLSEPITALRRMAAAVRPGGFVAVLENDTMHQLLLPWPHRLELALRAAETKALCEESSRCERYYVGRRLPAVLAAAGIEPLGFQTQCIDRRAPLDADLKSFLEKYFSRLTSRVAPYLAPEDALELKALVDPQNDECLFRQPFLTLSWLNILAWGRRPSGAPAGDP